MRRCEELSAFCIVSPMQIVHTMLEARPNPITKDTSR